MAHYLVAVALYYSGVLALRGWLRRRASHRPEVAVLCLHRILTAPQAAQTCSEPAMAVMLPTFLELLRQLKKQFQVLSLADLVCGNLPRGPRPNCLLTFDDAWLDTFKNAYPALREAGLRATVFVPTGLIGSGSFFWVERLNSLWRTCGEDHEALCCALGKELGLPPVANVEEAIAALKRVSAARRECIVGALSKEFSNGRQPGATDRFMDWEQLLAMSPVFEVGSHTVHHVLLDFEEEATANQELLASRATLQEKIGREVRALAYPSGSFNEQVCGWAAEAGYDCAFTIRPGTYRAGDNPLTVPRCLLQEGNITNPWGYFSPAMFHLRLTGWR